MAVIATAQAGPVNDTATWTGGVVPVAPNTAKVDHAVSVPDGYTWDIGHSPATDDATAAIEANADIDVGNSVTMTVRGDWAGVHDPVIGADTLIKFDTTNAADAANQLYKFKFRYLIVAATILSRTEIRGVTGRCQLRYVSGLNEGVGTVTGLKLTNCGTTAATTDATSGSWVPYPSVAYDFSLTDVLLSGCNGIYPATSFQPGKDASLNGVTFENSEGSMNFFYRAVIAPTTGERNITGCVFDKLLYDLAPEAVITNTIITKNSSGNSATFSGNFIDKSTEIAQTSLNAPVIEDCYFYVGNSTGNDHTLGICRGLDATTAVTNNVFERDSIDDVDQDVLVIGTAGSADACAITGNIFFSRAGDLGGAVCAALGASNKSFSFEHNTCQGTAGFVIGETYVGYIDMLTSFKSNIFVGQDSPSYMIHNINGSPLTDYFYSGSANNNLGFGLDASYQDCVFSSGTPGVNDVSADPEFVAGTRNLKNWDASLGGPGTAANAIAELRKRNETTWDNRYNIAALVTWVRAGFVPQNAAVDGAAHDGGDIGAMAYAAAPTAASSAPIGDSPLIT